MQESGFVCVGVVTGDTVTLTYLRRLHKIPANILKNINAGDDQHSLPVQYSEHLGQVTALKHYANHTMDTTDVAQMMFGKGKQQCTVSAGKTERPASGPQLRAFNLTSL